MADFRSDYGCILKEDDIILVSYLFSGFGTDTASTLLGISPEAFYMRKSRIKKALKLNNEEIAKKYLPYFEKRR
ncbi:MAG: hypothetical protein K6G86_02245 [Bacteroidales bacterium]|nr:hypothetical protein [Bacteroidales bacterium]